MTYLQIAEVVFLTTASLATLTWSLSLHGMGVGPIVAIDAGVVGVGVLMLKTVRPAFVFVFLAAVLVVAAVLLRP